MRVALRLVLPALLALALSTGGAAAPDGPHVDVVTFKGVVDAVNSQYVTRSLDRAAADGAEAVVILMDTPGGLDSSMRAITQKMLASPVPVVVYVSPSGARAGSAGVFVTLAADVAAMAPHTNIGAAHPVSGTGEPMDDTMTAKVTNDAAALIRTLAARRDRNAAWAERAVRESVSATESEALELRVVDVVASDLPDLLARLDGRTIAMAAGPRTLHTAGAAVWSLDMTLFERALHALIDPNIAYLLFTLGVWAIIAEFYHPGAILPGLTGVICLVLAFVSFESLPINLAGLVLLVVAMGLFIADVKAPTHGALTAGGIAAFVLGSLLLFSPVSPTTPALPDARVSPVAIGAMTVLLAAFFLFAVQAGIRAQRLPAATGGPRDLVGATGVAKSTLHPGGPSGTVLVRSEGWTAVTDRDEIAPGDRVEVVAAEGLRLRVRKKRVPDG